LRPVYLRRGGAFVKELLRRIGAGIDRESLRSAYPDDRELLSLLEHSRILQPPEPVRHLSPEHGKTCPSHNRITTYLTVTTACDLNCSYCLGGGKDPGTSSGKMSPETACRAVEQACGSVNPGGVVEVAFYGGEPLRNWPLVKAVGEACKGAISGRFPDREIRLSMISNLADLPDDLAQWSLDHGMTFLCDIDGPENVHDRQRPFADGAGSWAAVTANVRRLVTAGVPVGLRMTLTALNQSKMMETARLFKDLGAASCAFVPVQPVDCAGRFLPMELLPDLDAIVAGAKQVFESGIWDIEDLFPFSDFRRRLEAGVVGAGCGSFAGQTPVVSPGGNVYPCMYLAGDDSYCVGSLRDGASVDWGRMSGLRERLSTDNLPECRRCPWRSLCGGGCAVPRLRIGPDSDAPVAVMEYARRVNCAFTAAGYELLFWDQATRTHASLAGKTDAI
jgi:uncharacterized protein